MKYAILKLRKSALEWQHKESEETNHELGKDIFYHIQLRFYYAT